MDIIDKLAAVVGAEIEFIPEKCLHHTDRTSTCDNCVTLCPTDAITLGPPITHNPDHCVKCELCLHACPTGAFRGEDSRANLLANVAKLAARDELHRLELACKFHPSADVGPAEASGVLRLPGCLGSLSPSALVAMAALGIETISLRLDRCQGCPFGHAQHGIKESVSDTRQILATLGAPGEIVLITSAAEDDNWVQHPVRDAGGPVFSRRQVPGSATGEIPQAAGQALAADDLATRVDMPRERLRLLLALGRLPHTLDTLPADQGFARLEATDACTACGLCARVCPTGALQMLENEDGDVFHLIFRSGACTDCGACLPYCEPDALRMATTPPTLRELLNAEPVVLIAGNLRVCRKCGTRYAGPADSDLCPLCEFRRKNPFGSRMPAGGRRLPPHKQN